MSTYRIIQAGESRSFPTAHAFIEKGDPRGASHVFVGKDALFDGGRKPRFADVTDGTSNTLLVVEAAETVPWTKPADIPLGGGDPRTQGGGWYGDLFDLCMCDGSARTVDRKKVSNETFRNVIMPADGNLLGKDW